MQLCSRRRVCCRLVVRAPTGVDAIAIYAGQQPQLAADDAGASVHKGTSFYVDKATLRKRCRCARERVVSLR